MNSSKRTFVPEDLYHLVRVGDPQIRPDGEEVAFVRSHVEGDKKEMRSHIWIAPIDSRTTNTAAARPYTRSPHLDSQPRWSPDGRRLAFVRQTGDGPDVDRQIWIIERNGGEAWQLTTMRHGASNPIWSPDGRRLAFMAAVGDGESAAEAATAKTAAEREQEKQISLDESRLVTRFQYKYDPTGLLLPRRMHVWVVAVPEQPVLPGATTPTDADAAQTEAAASTDSPTAAAVETDTLAGMGQLLPQRVTSEPFDHTPLAWSPDGRHIAVSASYEDERKPVLDVWIFPVPGTGRTSSHGAAEAPVKLTTSDGLFYDARWSPCGKRLALVGHCREHRTATLNRLWLYPAPGHAGERTCLTQEWDRGIGGTVNSDVRPGMSGMGLTWAPDGGSVYFVADDRGTTQLYRAPVPAAPDGTAAAPVLCAGGPAEIYGFSLSRDGRRAAVAVADMLQPGDIYLLHLSDEQPEEHAEERVAVSDREESVTPDSPAARDGAPQFRSDCGWSRSRLTAVNAHLLNLIQFPAVEEIQFESVDGLPIHGWIMRPVNTEPGKKAPAILQIHGGPHTCWGHSFSLEMHLQAALGYAVIFVNPRGSASYGQQFTQACLGDYGGLDYKDLMAAVDYATGLGFIDEQKLAVTGGSYGGFMTNWIVTHTDRFRAGISHRSISNWVSFWGVSDIGPGFLQGEFGAESLWDGFDDMWERSPLKHAANVVTPLLLCHSENDLRCPLEQAEQFYTALKWLGKTAELLRHPRSNHDLTRVGPPTLRVDRFHHIARFLAEHVTGD